MSDERVSVTLETMNDILTYLGKRPYDEVAALITAAHKEAQLVKDVAALQKEDEDGED